MERSIELGFCTDSTGAIDMHDLRRGNETQAKLSFEKAGLESGVASALGTGWLESAAPVYNISKQMADYVVVPIILCPSGLPNRNGVAFSLAGLGRFDSEIGKLGFESWQRQPTFENHSNSNIEEAKGVIFDTRMVPLSGTSIWKVVALAGFDRTRDPVLANNILTGVWNSYSMGASVGSYECAVCGHKPTKASMSCEHISLDKRQMKTFEVAGRGRVLSHYICDFLRGFELSVVHPTPAWASAYTSPETLLNLGD